MENTSPMLMHSTYFKLGPENTSDIAEDYMKKALECLSTSKGMVSF
jgi:hypothetical protein